MSQKANPISMTRAERRRRIRNSLDRRLRLVAKLRRLVGVIIIIITVLTITVNGPKLSIKSITNIFDYIWSGIDDASIGTRIEYKTQKGSIVRAFNQGVVVVDNDIMSICTPSGVRLQTEIGYSSPAVSTSERYVLVYDKNGSQAVLTSNVAEASRQKLDASILSGSVGKTGDYSLIINESGYKTTVVVYTSGGKQRFKWSSPDYYFVSSAISPDGSSLAVTSFGSTQGAQLEGKLFLRDLNNEKKVTEVSIGSNVPIAVGFLDNSTVAVIGDYETVLINKRGKIFDKVSYAADDLKSFCFGAGELALAVRSYSGNARTEVYIAGSGGIREKTLEIAQELQAIDYDGSKIAVLTSNGITVYSASMKPLWKNESVIGAQSINLTDDGGVCVIYSQQAEHLSKSSDTSKDLRS